MARHPNRNWGVILQQAWSMFLKDKVSQFSGGRGGSHSNNGQGNSGVRRRLCFDFNAGNCTFGKKCKFDHRCSFCNKFGHGSYNCRKAKVNQTNGTHPVLTTSNSNSGNNNFHHNNFDAKDKNRWDKYEKEKECN